MPLVLAKQANWSDSDKMKGVGNRWRCKQGVGADRSSAWFFPVIASSTCPAWGRRNCSSFIL